MSVGLLARELESRGVRVRVLAAESPLRSTRVVVAPITAGSVAHLARAADLVHAYNVDALGPTLRGARRARVAAVATANSYRATCLWADQTFPDGELCPGCSLGRLRRDYRTRNPLTVGRRVPALLARAEVWRRTRTLSRYDSILVLSEASRRVLEADGIPAAKLVVLPNFADRFPAPPGRRRERRILFVGALKHTKGGGTLLEAAARLPGVPVDVVGEGPERAAWQQRAEELGMADRIVFHGHVPYARLPALFARARVLALPVWWPEPFGRVVLEAFHHGLPVVATDRGGPAETIEHERSGLVVPALDAEALAAALRRVLDDDSLFRRLSGGARDRLQAYQADRILPRLLEIYHSLVERRI